MQFPVPQFIDVEDKIIGPFTLKQFGFIFGAGIIILGLFKLLGTGIIFYLLALPIAGVAAILAFASFNGRKLYNFLPVMLKFLRSDKVLVFQQRGSDEQISVKPLDAETFSAITAEQAPEAPQESAQSKLRRIALALDQKNQEEFETFRLIKKQNGQR